MSVTKSDIANNIAFSASINKKDSLNFLSFFLKTIAINSKNKKVKVAKFGCFYKNQSPQRIGRNPKTSEEFIIPTIKRISFHASNEVKKILN